ncbi:MAG: hypothetical protein JXQ71_12365 [Verrucomicrobia bacterium]|nr:hypothetical protein [Verrucomicrobiota bacterium]
MNLLKILQGLRRHSKRVAVAAAGALGLLVAADAVPGLVDKSEAHTWLEANVPGFWALFGLVGCILLIVLSKGLGRLGIMTREDYYDD